MAGLAAERYRALILTSPALVWRASPEGAVLEGWGVEGDPAAFPEALMGFAWMERIHPEDKPGVLALWNRATIEGICPPIDYRIDRGQGGFRWVQVRTVALRNGDGSVREWVGTLADIHEERMAAAAVKVEQERLQLAVESTGLGIWDHQFAASRTWWSEGTKALLGWPEDDDAVGFEPLLRLVHPEDREEFEKEVSRALEAGGNGRLHQELRIFRASDGAERWVLSVGRAFFDEAGMPTRFLGTLRDVTESRRTKDTLKGSEDRFRQVASTSPNACITIDQRGRITFWNRGAERIFGLPLRKPSARRSTSSYPNASGQPMMPVSAASQCRRNMPGALSRSLHGIGTGASFPSKVPSPPGWKVLAAISARCCRTSPLAASRRSDFIASPISTI
jgi:PAS domain S-box-containing protein